MDKNFSTLANAINSLKEKGYTEDFNLVEDGLESKALKEKWEAGNLEVVDYYRFEGMSNPADNSILYAVQTGDGVRGLLVDNYAAKGQSVNTEMLKKLRIE
jgi:hypothetical protein